MNEHIDALLRALADDDARMEAPPRVETAVMRAWQSHPPAAGGHWPVAGSRLVAGGLWLVARGWLVAGSRCPVAHRARKLMAGSWWPVANRQPGNERRRIGWALLSLTAAAVLIVAIVLRPNASVPTTSVATGASAATELSSSRVDRLELTATPASVMAPQQRPRVAFTPRNPATQLPSHRARATSYQPPAARESVTSYEPYFIVGTPRDAAPLSVVRLRMARSALATLGLPLPNPDAAAIVDVDVFVGEDGIARAIRPVALVSSLSQE
jgi:hypothetical protein